MPRSMLSHRLIDGFVAASDADKAAAEACFDRGLYPLAAFHWQQAAEKRLTAAIIAAGFPVEPTHDLVRLCRLLSDRLPAAVWPPTEDVLDLTRVVVEARYPLAVFDFRSPADVVTRRVAERCRSVAAALIAEADRILAWARDAGPEEPTP